MGMAVLFSLVAKVVKPMEPCLLLWFWNSAARSQPLRRPLFRMLARLDLLRPISSVLAPRLYTEDHQQQTALQAASVGRICQCGSSQRRLASSVPLQSACEYLTPEILCCSIAMGV